MGIKMRFERNFGIKPILAGLFMFLMGRYLPKPEWTTQNFITGIVIGFSMWFIYFIILNIRFEK